MEQNNNKILIIGGFALLAVAIIGFGIYAGLTGTATQEKTANQEPVASSELSIPLLKNTDAIAGSPDAKVVLFEYSDIECPYCQKFHAALEKIQPQYDSKEFAWVFRHFPLPMHENATLYAKSSICVQKSAGIEAFWKFTSSLMQKISDGAPLNDSGLAALASKFGVGKDTLTSCVSDKSLDKMIEDSMNEAKIAGGTGTPFNVFYVKDGISQETESAIKQGLGDNVRISSNKKFLALSGAPSDESFISLINLLLGKK